jgi:predicted hotdog family 3-hydroxylacyl-ACP dehydratase
MGDGTEMLPEAFAREVIAQAITGVARRHAMARGAPSKTWGIMNAAERAEAYLLAETALDALNRAGLKVENA